MCADIKKKNKKPIRRSKFKIFLIILLVLIIAVFSLIPTVISSSACREFILGKIKTNFDGSVNFSSLSFGWFKGIEISDVHLQDSLLTTTVDIKKIQTNPSYLSFLTSVPNLGRTIIDNPQITLNIADNQSGQAQQEQVKTESQTDKSNKPQTPILAAAFGAAKIDLQLNNGLVLVNLENAKTVSFTNIAANVQLAGTGSRNIVDFSADVVSSDSSKSSPVKAYADVTPGKGWSFDTTSGDFTVEVNELDLSTISPILKMTGSPISTKGVLSVNLAASVQRGTIKSVLGDAFASGLDIGLDSAGKNRIKTSKFTVDIGITESGNLYNVDKFTAVSDWLNINASGTAAKDFKSSLAFDGDFDFDIAKAASMMPTVFQVKEGVKLTAGNVAGSIAAQSSNGVNKISGSAVLKGLSAIADGTPFSLSKNVNLDFSVIPTQENIEIENIALTSSFADVSLRGSAQQFNYDVNADLLKLQNEIGKLFDFKGYSFNGLVRLNGSISTVKQNVTVKGTSKLTGLKLVKGQFAASEPSANISYDIDYLKSDSMLNINEFDYAGQIGDITIGSSSIPLDSKSGLPMNVILKADADLAKVMPFLVLTSAVPQDLSIGGKLDSSLRFSMAADNISINTENTKIINPAVRYQGKDVFVQDGVDIDFVGEFNLKAKTVNIEKIKFISPQIKILKGFVSQKTVGANQKIEGQIDYDIDLTTGSTILDPFLPESFNLQGKVADSLSFNSTYPFGKTDKILAGLNGKTSLGFDRAEYMGLKFNKTKINIEFVNGLMNIKPFSTVVNSGKLNFGGSADFKQTNPLLRISEPMAVLDKVYIDNDMAAKMLKYLNPIFANATRVEGTGNFYCKQLAIPLSAGRTNELLIDGNISMTGIKITGGGILSQIANISGLHNPNVNIEILPTNFIMQNGQLHYDDMQVNFGNSPVNFTGNIYVDKPMNMMITMPWTVFGETAKVGTAVNNRIKLAIGGNADKPKIDESTTIQQNIGNILEGLINKK